MAKIGTERLKPVCDASGHSLYAYWSSQPKDKDGKAPCPVCGKRLKMVKRGLDRFPGTIPHHHTGDKQ